MSTAGKQPTRADSVLLNPAQLMLEQKTHPESTNSQQLTLSDSQLSVTSPGQPVQPTQTTGSGASNAEPQQTTATGNTPSGAADLASSSSSAHSGESVNTSDMISFPQHVNGPETTCRPEGEQRSAVQPPQEVGSTPSSCVSQGAAVPGAPDSELMPPPPTHWSTRISIDQAIIRELPPALEEFRSHFSSDGVVNYKKQIDEGMSSGSEYTEEGEDSSMDVDGPNVRPSLTKVPSNKRRRKIKPVPNFNRDRRPKSPHDH